MKRFGESTKSRTRIFVVMGLLLAILGLTQAVHASVVDEGRAAMMERLSEGLAAQNNYRTQVKNRISSERMAKRNAEREQRAGEPLNDPFVDAVMGRASRSMCNNYMQLCVHGNENVKACESMRRAAMAGGTWAQCTSAQSQAPLLERQRREEKERRRRAEQAERELRDAIIREQNTRRVLAALEQSKRAERSVNRQQDSNLASPGSTYPTQPDVSPRQRNKPPKRRVPACGANAYTHGDRYDRSYSGSKSYIYYSVEIKNHCTVALSCQITYSVDVFDPEYRNAGGGGGYRGANFPKGGTVPLRIPPGQTKRTPGFGPVLRDDQSGRYEVLSCRLDR